MHTAVHQNKLFSAFGARYVGTCAIPACRRTKQVNRE